MKPKKKPKRRLAATMQSAVSITGLSLEVVRNSKKAGCDAFKVNGNVDCDRLIEWLTEHKGILETSGDSPSFELERALKTRAERKLKEHDLELKQRNSIPTTEVRSVLVRSLFAFKKRLMDVSRRCSQSIAAETDVILITEKIDHEISHALDELSQGGWWKEHNEE